MSSSESASPRLPPASARGTSMSALPRPLTPRSSLTIAVSLRSSRSARRTSRSLPTSKPRACATPSSSKTRRLPSSFRAIRASGRPRRAGSRAGRRARPRPERWRTAAGTRARAARRGRGSLDRTRPSEQLPRQRQVAAVDERDDRKAAARLGRVQLGHEPEVVVEEPGQDRLGGDVDDPRPARAQQAQHEAEEPLLVRGEDGDQMVGNVHADRVDDHHRALDVPNRAQRHRRPQRSEPLLERGELAVRHVRTVTQW